ncbi:hypothetical protein VTO73DRAFT_9719 [Trametes versicolor]
MSASEILRGLTLAVAADWATTLGLIFGGCCSNALTLEHLTRSHPHAGSLITFAQFVLISLHGLPKFLVLGRGRWGVPWLRLRARRTPLAPYLAQVALFYAVSLLNNAAFAYGIPMAVHIIFRSGGLVVSMLMGWLLAGKRYNVTQVLSVLVVTAGVFLTTLSAATPKNKAPPSPSDTEDGSAPESLAGLSREQWRYASGIGLLTLALVLSGLLGIVQDWTYARYVRTPAPATSNGAAENGTKQTNGHANGHTNGHANGHAKTPDVAATAPAAGRSVEPWQESMFYLHFLSLPMFYFVRHDLAAQARALHASPPLRLSLPLPPTFLAKLQTALTLYPPFGLLQPPSFFSEKVLTLRIPGAHATLALTAATALVCVAGVHRLTARGVSALAVTLLLVVRKAASLVLSVLLFRAQGAAVNAGVWAGAGMVFAGTMGYAAGSRKTSNPVTAEKEKKE